MLMGSPIPGQDPPSGPLQHDFALPGTELPELGGSKGGMKVGGVKEASPNIIESTRGIL